VSMEKTLQDMAAQIVVAQRKRVMPFFPSKTLASIEFILLIKRPSVILFLIFDNPLSI
jgi:hypothetical protein